MGGGARGQSSSIAGRQRLQAEVDGCSPMEGWAGKEMVQWRRVSMAGSDMASGITEDGASHQDPEKGLQARALEEVNPMSPVCRK